MIEFCDHLFLRCVKGGARDEIQLRIARYSHVIALFGLLDVIHYACPVWSVTENVYHWDRTTHWKLLPVISNVEFCRRMHLSRSIVDVKSALFYTDPYYNLYPWTTMMTDFIESDGFHR